MVSKTIKSLNSISCDFEKTKIVNWANEKPEEKD
jgi:hypothetical protein